MFSTFHPLKKTYRQPLVLTPFLGEKPWVYNRPPEVNLPVPSRLQMRQLLVLQAIDLARLPHEALHRGVPTTAEAAGCGGFGSPVGFGFPKGSLMPLGLLGGFWEVGNERLSGKSYEFKLSPSDFHVIDRNLDMNKSCDQCFSIIELLDGLYWEERRSNNMSRTSSSHIVSTKQTCHANKCDSGNPDLHSFSLRHAKSRYAKGTKAAKFAKVPSYLGM